ncbi:GntR family transcriptional regulator [Marinitenerispora sediminis]|uniref:UbiC transcription regulator-associated domain-containing protein n=1 Tax=Marinitenerispora sediminis TaxID=1931232 RepID=A0A368T5I7_9ACTN|nr:UTRA domain-containing protein [Marinitenerispora sediminis]RCV54291.1 hypothetical protein DEF23_16145 [Marinitenerispora sediminis]RCV56421.1 hypothetical protein DEF28_03730 [Marinitenerispora sediminis]RCV58623.1 hypothetical protein DEF24_12820 [Marinitenerispora sediminis]
MRGVCFDGVDGECGEQLVNGQVGIGLATFPLQPRRPDLRTARVPLLCGNQKRGQRDLGDLIEDVTGTESHDLLEVTEIPAPAEVADRLGSEAGGSVVVRRRLIRLDDVPAGLIESYYPADIARGTPLAEARHYDSGTIRPLLDLASYDETVFATMPTPDERQQMYIAEGTPLLGRWRISYNSDNRPVQVTRQLVAADRYTFKHQHPIS